MNEVDEFLAAVLPLQRQADLALLKGDAAPRKMLWSHAAPVTVLGAARTVSGWPEVESLFDWLASNFSNGTLYDLDVAAAGVSGDLGYVVGAEHSKASVAGEDAAAIELRITLIFRREDGEWKEVHRHADPIPGIRSTQRAAWAFQIAEAETLPPLDESVVGLGAANWRKPASVADAGAAPVGTAILEATSPTGRRRSAVSAPASRADEERLEFGLMVGRSLYNANRNLEFKGIRLAL